MRAAGYANDMIRRFFVLGLMLAGLLAVWQVGDRAGVHAATPPVIPLPTPLPTFSAMPAIPPPPPATLPGTPSTFPSPSPLATASPAVPLPAGGRLGIIKIEGVIREWTFESLKWRVDKALAEGCSILVIELDTPGGELEATLKITQYLRSLPPGVQAYAWVNPRAYSAGAIIAVACSGIIMSHSGVIGDAAPIWVEASMSPTERAKVLSPLLADLRESASKNHIDFAVLHAMVELGVEVYQVQNSQTGERRLVNQADYRVMVLGHAMAEVGPPLDVNAATRPEAILGGVRPLIARDDMRGQWSLVHRIHDGKTLLTLTSQEAIDAGLAMDRATTDGQLQQTFQAVSIRRVHHQWLQGIAYWMTYPAVRAVLVIMLVIGAYVEFQAPGFGVGGTLALVALAGLLIPPYLVGLGQLWHILLFFVGFLLLLIELVTPNFGIMGTLGIVLMFVGLVLAAVPSRSGGIGMPSPAAMDELQMSFLAILAGLVVSAVGVVILTQYFGSVPGLNRLILGREQTRGVAGGTQPGDQVEGDSVIAQGTLTLGTTGRVLTELRPVGKADLAGHVVDVMTQGGWIPTGRLVKVIEIQGNRITVEETNATT